MGRGHLIRLAALVAALVCVPAALAGTRVSWVLHGTTVPNGSQAPRTYLAVARSGLGPWVRRLTTSDQARVRGVDFARNVVVAGFLDGSPCAFDLRFERWSLTARRLTVVVSYRKPPIGVATCVRTSTGYLVVGLSRTVLGRAPMAAEMQFVARS